MRISISLIPVTHFSAFKFNSGTNLVETLFFMNHVSTRSGIYILTYQARTATAKCIRVFSEWISYLMKIYPYGVVQFIQVITIGVYITLD